MINTGSRYEFLPGFLLGFHGTDSRTAREVFSGRSGLVGSLNDYDWLGHGTYFWEYSPQRAYQFAVEKFRWEGRKAKIEVIGAVIDPGHCLNLLEASALTSLKEVYDVLVIDRGGKANLPRNGTGSKSWDRKLDCAVINMLHKVREITHEKKWQRSNPKESPLPLYDSVRGAFWEGNPLYEGARIEERNHVQICIRNHECIKGYFRPIVAI